MCYDIDTLQIIRTSYTESRCVNGIRYVPRCVEIYILYCVLRDILYMVRY